MLMVLGAAYVWMARGVCRVGVRACDCSLAWVGVAGGVFFLAWVGGGGGGGGEGRARVWWRERRDAVALLLPLAVEKRVGRGVGGGEGQLVRGRSPPALPGAAVRRPLVLPVGRGVCAVNVIVSETR